VKVEIVINKKFEETLARAGSRKAFTLQLLADVSESLRVEPRRLACLKLQSGSICAQIGISAAEVGAHRSAQSLGHDLCAQAHDRESRLRQLQPHITSARICLNSSVDYEDEEALEAQAEQRMAFLAHGAHGRGRTGDSMQAIEEQQASIRQRYSAIEGYSAIQGYSGIEGKRTIGNKTVAVPAELASSMAGIVRGHVDDLQAHKMRPQKGMAAVELRHELDRLEQRNGVMVETCLALYQQLLTGGKNNLVEDLKRQITESEAAHVRHDELFADGIRVLQDKFQESHKQLMKKSKEAMELRTAYDVETTKLRHEKQGMEVRMQAQIDVLTTKLEQDSEFSKLRGEIDRLLVLQTSSANAQGVESIGHLQAQLKKALSTRLQKGTGAQTEEEKKRMAMGGLVTEVEVLSLTNAQLVLDLHRLRQERQHFEERCAGLQRERDQLHEQLNTTLPQTRLLTSQCAEHKLQIQTLTLQVQQRKHLKTPAGRWVALSMLASRQDLDDDLHTQRKDFEEWMHDRREQLEQQSRLEQQKLLDRVEEKDKLVADLRHELRTEILLKEEQMSEVARMQSDRHLFDQGCQNDVSAAQSELTLALRSVKDLETQVCLALSLSFSLFLSLSLSLTHTQTESLFLFRVRSLSRSLSLALNPSPPTPLPPSPPPSLLSSLCPSLPPSPFSLPRALSPSPSFPLSLPLSPSLCPSLSVMRIAFSMAVGSSSLSLCPCVCLCLFPCLCVSL